MKPLRPLGSCGVAHVARNVPCVNPPSAHPAAPDAGDRIGGGTAVREAATLDAIGAIAKTPRHSVRARRERDARTVCVNDIEDIETGMGRRDDL